jgi:NADPH-dependent 2,4-dienoyl-CoA reductase/sulfur reductase-like enzyme
MMERPYGVPMTTPFPDDAEHAAYDPESGSARHRPGRGRRRPDRRPRALLVDRRMRTNLPDVLAAGDCVETWHRLLAHPSYLPLGTTAHKQGRVAGETAVGGDRTFAGSLGTQVVKVFELAVARTGLRDHEAQAAGFDPLTVASTQFDHKAYYPGAHQLHLRITGHRASGRLLGAQLVGDHRTQVAKRIDIPPMPYSTP